MNKRDQQSSLTEPSYWEKNWQSVEAPRLVDLSDRSLRNHANIAFHNYFSEVLRDASLQSGALVEIGCAQPKWLPYFAKIHGLAVTGLDYSEIGCARARALLQQAQCEGDIVQADMFNPPDDLRSRFDVVLLIPNMTGIVGLGQRWLDRRVYDKHVPLDREALQAAHEQCGLSILRSEYLLSGNFAVINHPNLKPKIINRLVCGLLVAATGGVWALERLGFTIPATAFLSPYIVCVGSKARAAPSA